MKRAREKERILKFDFKSIRKLLKKEYFNLQFTADLEALQINVCLQLKENLN